MSDKKIQYFDCFENSVSTIEDLIFKLKIDYQKLYDNKIQPGGYWRTANIKINKDYINLSKAIYDYDQLTRSNIYCIANQQHNYLIEKLYKYLPSFKKGTVIPKVLSFRKGRPYPYRKYKQAYTSDEFLDILIKYSNIITANLPKNISVIVDNILKDITKLIEIRDQMKSLFVFDNILTLEEPIHYNIDFISNDKSLTVNVINDIKKIKLIINREMYNLYCYHEDESNVYNTLFLKDVNLCHDILWSVENTVHKHIIKEENLLKINALEKSLNEIVLKINNDYKECFNFMQILQEV